MSDASNGDSEPLTSPLEGAPVGRYFVIGGPICLAAAIMVSLWVSYLHVRFTLVVQAPVQMQSGRPFVVRTQVVPEGSAPVPPLEGEAWLERDGVRLELGALLSARTDGIMQASVIAPALDAGPASLHVALRSATGEGMEPMHESVEVRVEPTLPPLDPKPMVAGSTLQHGDDSQPQPPGARIVVRSHGRLLSEFDNTLYVRVTKNDGTPWVGEVEVALVSGAYGGSKAHDGVTPVLARGAVDPWGVLPVRGLLSSAVLRIQVRVLGGDDTPLHQRTVRMVSFAGGVVLRPSTHAVAPAEPAVELSLESLRHKRPVFVDVHGPAGAWISTVTPPLKVGEEPRPWTVQSVPAGVLQFEAYPTPHAPGESTALARVQVVDGDPQSRASLKPLVALQRAGLHAARVEAHYDAALEAQYWAAVEGIELTPQQVGAAREFLLGTLPVSAYGPEVALVTRERVLAAMASHKRDWTIGMRWVLLGGGGLFLALMTVAMVRTHSKEAALTLAALDEHGDDAADAMRAVTQAQRAGFLRGLAVIFVMALALAGTTLMLESLLWTH
ncbi:MAG: hypothetical protein KUG77_12615 [Nannocystaceae bacterium]|nr:hypothetical protein [Nannocystaceae bacterium]